MIEGYPGSLDLELWLRVVWHVVGYAHPHGAETVKDVDLGAHVLGCGFGHGLEHRVGERREDVVDLGEEKGEEAVIAIPEDREDGHELVEVVTWTEGEGLGVHRFQREDVSKGAGNIEELLDL